MEVAPRTRILGAVPKVPEIFWMDTPAERPSSPLLMSAMPSILTSEAESLSAAPVNNRLSVATIPVTTTSSSISELACKVIFIVGATFTSSLCMPTKETTSCAFCGAEILNFPSMSVMVPFDLSPLIWMVAPITGSSCSSTTIPVTFIWENATPIPQKRKETNKISFCFISINI